MLQQFQVPDVDDAFLSSRDNVPVSKADLDVHDDVGVPVKHTLQAAVAHEPDLDQSMNEHKGVFHSAYLSSAPVIMNLFVKSNSTQEIDIGCSPRLACP